MWVKTNPLAGVEGAGSGKERSYWEEPEVVFKKAAAFKAAGPGDRSIKTEQTWE